MQSFDAGRSKNLPSHPAADSKCGINPWIHAVHFWWNQTPPPPLNVLGGPPKQGSHSMASADLLCEVRRILSLAEMSFGWAGRPLGSLRDVSPDGSQRSHTRGKGHRSHRSAGLDPVSAYRVSLFLFLSLSLSLFRITTRRRQLGGMNR